MFRDFLSTLLVNLLLMVGCVVMIILLYEIIVPKPLKKSMKTIFLFSIKSGKFGVGFFCVAFRILFSLSTRVGKKLRANNKECDTEKPNEIDESKIVRADFGRGRRAK